MKSCLASAHCSAESVGIMIKQPWSGQVWECFSSSLQPIFGEQNKHTHLVQGIPDGDTELRAHTNTKLWHCLHKKNNTTCKPQENKCCLFGSNPERETQGRPIIVLFQKQSFWIKENKPHHVSRIF